MKICFVIPTLTAGGAERVVSTLANYWGNLGWQVSVLVLDKTFYPPAYPLHPSIRFESIEVFDKPKNYLRKLAVTLKQVYLLRKSITAINPQVVVSFVYITNLLACLATIFSGSKLVVSERSNPKMSTTNPLLKRMNFWWVFRQADGLVVQTERVKAFLPPTAKSKAVVIPNPILRPPAYYQREATCYKKIVTIGRLEYEKAYDVLIRAFAHVCSSHPDWKLVIVGQGSLEDNLKKLCIHLCVQDQVEWLGSTNNVYNVLAKADIFVLSSRYEGFPNALCEAMAGGLAVVATDCEFGPREIIKDQENGLLTPVDDEEALAQSISRFIENDDLRLTLGKKAEQIASTYALNSVSQRWEKVLKSVIN